MTLGGVPVGAADRMDRNKGTDRKNGTDRSKEDLAIEAAFMREERGGGVVIAGGAASRHIRPGDEVSIMSFTWSDDPQKHFSSILVDENNHFVRYLKEIAGEKL